MANNRNYTGSLLSIRATRKHPCTGCKTYHEKDRPVGRIRCPVLGREIVMEVCNRIGGATATGAWKKVEAIKEAGGS